MTKPHSLSDFAKRVLVWWCLHASYTVYGLEVRGGYMDGKQIDTGENRLTLYSCRHMTSEGFIRLNLWIKSKSITPGGRTLIFHQWFNGLFLPGSEEQWHWDRHVCRLLWRENTRIKSNDTLKPPRPLTASQSIRTLQERFSIFYFRPKET